VQNNVTVEEIKEIAEVLNYGDQCILDNKIEPGTNQVVPMNMHHSEEAKKEKRAHGQFNTRKKKKERHKAVRSVFDNPNLTNREIKELLKKPPDISKNPSDAEIHLFELLKGRDQRESPKKPPDKPWKSRSKCKELADVFYEKFVLERKGVSTRRRLGEKIKKFSTSIHGDSLWSTKKVFCTFIMIQGLVRRRDLDEDFKKSRKMFVTPHLKPTSATNPPPGAGA
jgi:hypothetical protein